MTLYGLLHDFGVYWDHPHRYPARTAHPAQNSAPLTPRPTGHRGVAYSVGGIRTEMGGEARNSRRGGAGEQRNVEEH